MKYKTFLEAAEDYLEYRRRLGFALRTETSSAQALKVKNSVASPDTQIK